MVFAFLFTSIDSLLAMRLVLHSDNGENIMRLS